MDTPSPTNTADTTSITAMDTDEKSNEDDDATTRVCVNRVFFAFGVLVDNQTLALACAPPSVWTCGECGGCELDDIELYGDLRPSHLRA